MGANRGGWWVPKRGRSLCPASERRRAVPFSRRLRALCSYELYERSACGWLLSRLSVICAASHELLMKLGAGS